MHGLNAFIKISLHCLALEYLCSKVYILLKPVVEESSLIIWIYIEGWEILGKFGLKELLPSRGNPVIGAVYLTPESKTFLLTYSDNLYKLDLIQTILIQRKKCYF